MTIYPKDKTKYQGIPTAYREDAVFVPQSTCWIKSNCFHGYMCSLGSSVVLHAFSKKILGNHRDFPSSWSSPGIVTGSVYFPLI